MKSALRQKLRQVTRTRIRSVEERAQQVLDERTQRLAERADLQAVAEPVRSLVCRAGREYFGLSLSAVAEVLSYRECMPIPDAPPAMVGIFGRNGRLVSVIDLALALGLESTAPEDGGWHLVLLRQEQPQVALRIDRAYAVSNIEPLAEGEAGAFRNDAVTGYARALSGPTEEGRTISLLDTVRLLHPLLPSSPVPGV